MVVKTTVKKAMRRDSHDVDVIFLQVNQELGFFQISLVVMMIWFHLHSYPLFHPHPSCKAISVPQRQAPIHQRVKNKQKSHLKTVIMCVDIAHDSFG